MAALYNVAELTIGTDSVIINSNRLRILTLAVSHDADVDVTLYFKFSGDATKYFQTVLGVSHHAFFNLVGSALEGPSGNSFQMFTSPSGTGTVYVTVGYEILV